VFLEGFNSEWKLKTGLLLRWGCSFHVVLVLDCLHWATVKLPAGSDRGKKVCSGYGKTIRYVPDGRLFLQI
jgi:hypothetical protein